MTDLSAFPITAKWPAQHPDRLQLYSLPTPNGVKVSIMLEETGLPYEPHKVDFAANDQMSPEFLSLNPNNKIPAILDPNGPDGKPLALFESGAILVYLAEKTGKFLPADAAGRYAALQWVMFQMGGVGPMFGQLGFFHRFAGKEIEDKRPRDRYGRGIAPSARRARQAPRGQGVDARRRLLHRRHRAVSLGAQSRRLLRGRGSRRLLRLRRGQARARCLRRPPGGAARAGDPGARLTRRGEGQGAGHRRPQPAGGTATPGLCR